MSSPCLCTHAKCAALLVTSRQPSFCVTICRTANELPTGSPLRRFQRGMTRYTGFTLPLYFGTGLLLPWGFLPFPVKLEVVVGEPLEVPKFEGEPRWVR